MSTLPQSQMEFLPLHVGASALKLEVIDGALHSLGGVVIGDTPVRNTQKRFLPWCDTVEGEVFRRFLLQDVETDGETARIRLRVYSDPDTMFRERRDGSGDLCFRAEGWDTTPREADLTIELRAASSTIGGVDFTGFTYWFAYQSDDVSIHRLVDRQTWELGGGLDGNTLCLRNWLTPPRVRLGREMAYTTSPEGDVCSLMPGNLWARWGLLPSFDFQYGPSGTLLGAFDQVSLIRSVIATQAGEACLRVQDLHLFPLTSTVTTNPKTILWSPAVLDDVAALNLWTRMVDQEAARARKQFCMPEEAPPAVVFFDYHWVGFDFNTSYEATIDATAEFGGEYVFIDSIWEHRQAHLETLNALVPPDRQQGTILEKVAPDTMCSTLDFQVAERHGGEAGLTALCTRAREKGVGILSWMACHVSPLSTLIPRFQPDADNRSFGIIATRESGRHPDTGYAAACWPINLHTPVYDYLREQLLGVCRRTGVAGFFWDSFCNLGWWQLDDLAHGLRPQFEKMGELYADLTHAGLYLMPESLVGFSSHAALGTHGGEHYTGELAAFAYNSNIPGGVLEFWESDSISQVLTGERPFRHLFECIAHKRIPVLVLHRVPRERWAPGRAEAIRELLRCYRDQRRHMCVRTVFHDDHDVRWDGDAGVVVFFSFQHQAVPFAGGWADAATGVPVQASGLLPDRVYTVTGAVPMEVSC